MVWCAALGRRGLGIGRPGLLAFPREGRKRRPWRQCAAWASAGQGCSLSLKSMRRPWRQCAASPGGMSPSFFLSCLSAPVPPRRGSHSRRRQARGCVRAARRQQRGGCGIGRPLLARSEQAALAAAGCGGVISDSMLSSVGRSCLLAARRRQQCLVASAGRVRVRCRPAGRAAGLPQQTPRLRRAEVAA